LTVNDAELKSMYDKVSTELDIVGKRKTELNKFKRNCVDIIKQPTEDDPQIMKSVMDKNLGIKMSTTRRQAIYDKLLADKITLELS